MALKDIWTNKTDGVDDILADDINAIANEVISNTENKAEQSYVDSAINKLNEKTNMAINDINLNISQIDSLWRDKADKATVYTKSETDTILSTKADKATTYTATETDDMLSTKADKADLDWKLIGEEEVTEADITAAGENGVTAVTIDLGAPIEQWYRETRIDIYIPQTWNTQSKTGLNSERSAVRVNLGKTITDSTTPSLPVENGTTIIQSQSNGFATIYNEYANGIVILSQWENSNKLIYSQYINSGFNGALYPQPVHGATSYNIARNAKGLRFLTLYSYPIGTNKFIFKFPAGTKISLYGRM